VDQLQQQTAAASARLVATQLEMTIQTVCPKSVLLATKPQRMEHELKQTVVKSAYLVLNLKVMQMLIA